MVNDCWQVDKLRIVLPWDIVRKIVVYMLGEDIVVKTKLFGVGTIVVNFLLRPLILVSLKLIGALCGSGDSFGI